MSDPTEPNKDVDVPEPETFTPRGILEFRRDLDKTGRKLARRIYKAIEPVLEVLNDLLRNLKDIYLRKSKDYEAALVCPDCGVDAYYYYEKPQPGETPMAENSESPGDNIEARPGEQIECWNCGHLFQPPGPYGEYEGTLHMDNIRELNKRST